MRTPIQLATLWSVASVLLLAGPSALAAEPPSKKTAPGTRVAQAEATEMDLTSEELPEGLFDPGAAAAEEAPVQQAAPQPDPNLVVQQLMRQFSREPSALEVQKACVEYFKVAPDEINSLRARASFKALLPNVRFEMSGTSSDDDSLTDDEQSVSADGSRLRVFSTRTQAVSDGDTWTVSGDWALGNLVFNPEVLDVASLIGIQEGLLREITGLYYTRRRLQVSMALNPPQDPGEMLTEMLRLEEIAGMIDALTGGYFSRALREAGMSTTPAPAGFAPTR